MRWAAAHLAVLAAFLLLSIILTFPLITHVETHVPGSELWAFDEYAFVWNLWWFKHALLHLSQSPLSTGFIFYPVGVDLALYTFTWFNAAAALPLLPWYSLAAVSNGLTLFATTFSAYGAYLLMKVLLAGRSADVPERAAESVEMSAGRWRLRVEALRLEGAAIGAAIAYTFTSSRFVYAAFGHYDMVGTEWIPFFVLYFVKSLSVPTRRHAVLAGLFLALALYVEMIFGVLLALLVLAYVVVVRPWRITSLRRTLAQLAITGAAAALMFLPVLMPVLSEILDAEYALRGWGEAQKLSVDLLGYVSPTSLNTWAGRDWNRELVSVAEGRSRFSDVNTVFLGYGTMALAAIGWLANRRPARVWAVGALAFAVLGLGPILQIGGQSGFDLDGLKVNVPLPFIALHYIPIVQANRVPNRVSVVLMLCLAVLVGYAVWYIGGKLAGVRPPWPVLAFLPMVSLLLLLDHLSLPLPLTDARVPAFYETLAADTDDYAILQLPLGWRNSFGTQGAEDTRVQYYQTTHHKRILGGNTSRNPPFKFEYFSSLPIVSSLIRLEEYKEVSAEQLAFDRAQADEFIRFFGLRYVTVHPPVPGRHPYDDTRAAALQYLRDVLPLEEVYSGSDLLVYRLRQPEPSSSLEVDFGEPSSRMYRGDGWGRDERVSGPSANWAIRTRARVFLPVQEAAGYRLTFAALPFIYPNAPPQTVSMVVNGRLRLPAIELAQTWSVYEVEVPAAALQSGLNELVFEFAHLRAPREVFEPTPEMLASGTKHDPRQLAAAVDWIRWERR